jgi:hypothetical protein
MSTTVVTSRITRASARHRGKLVGVYYLLTMLMGALVLFFHGRLAFAADLIATIFYIAVTVLFYGLSKKLRLTSNGRKTNPDPPRLSK